MSNLPQPYQVEQTIKKQITIAAGLSGKISIPIPKDYNVAVKGYGYTYYSLNTFQLVVGDVMLPSRTDQEGSASIPRIFDSHIVARAGANVEFRIINGDTSDHTYEVVLYFYLNKYFPDTSTYQSEGGALVINTAGSAGTGNNVVIYDSTLTTPANVTAAGVEVDASAPSVMLQGTATANAAGAALAASTACKKVTIHTKISASKDADGYSIKVGNATGQEFPLLAGAYMDIAIDNLSKVYVKRAGASDVTVYYAGG